MGGSILAESEPENGSVFTAVFPLQAAEQTLEQVKQMESVQTPTEEVDTFDIKSSEIQDTKDIQMQETDQISAEDAESLGYADKRVLIVEDVELNMEIAEAMIGMTGVQIEKAYNGQEAVQMVREKPIGYFDLIFMDIQMPVMDGYEATRRIRAMRREDGEQIPIYALSANALAEDIENALQAGMNGHIAKPIDRATIEKVLRQHLSESQK